MAFKIYISGNILYIQDTVENIQYEGIARNCLHKRPSDDSDLFSFTGVNKLDVYKQINFGDMRTKANRLITVDYPNAQAFSDYLDGELGKSSAQESAPTQGTSSFNALEPSVQVTDNNLNTGDTIMITPTVTNINEFYFATVVVNNSFTVNRIVINALNGLTLNLPFKWRKIR